MTEILLAKTDKGKKVHVSLSTDSPCGMHLKKDDSFFGFETLVDCERCKQFLESVEKQETAK